MVALDFFTHLITIVSIFMEICAHKYKYTSLFLAAIKNTAAIAMVQSRDLRVSNREPQPQN